MVVALWLVRCELRSARRALGLGVLLALAAALGLAAAATERGGAGGSERQGLAALPEAARGPVSNALGRDQRAYHARREAGAIALANRPHRLAAAFTPAGVRVRSGQARLGLALDRVGYGERLRSVAPAAPRARQNRVSYRRGALSEWYSNGPLGLEQGFTLRSPPPSAAGAR